MAVSEQVDVRQLSASTTDSSVDFGRSVRQIIVWADADVYIDFDQEATTSTGFLIKANAVPLRVNVRGCTELHAITASGTAKVYVIGIR